MQALRCAVKQTSQPSSTLEWPWTA